MANTDHTPDYCDRAVLVLGCGNILFGDDGFGPAVIEHLSGRSDLPGDVCLLDVGTSAREILFDIALSDNRPRRIIVVDAMDCGQEPGTVLEVDLDAIPENKRDDFSMHQAPTSNLLRELRDFCGTEVVLIVCQPASIPDEVEPGLSALARGAVARAARAVLEQCTLEGLRVGQELSNGRN